MRGSAVRPRRARRILRRAILFACIAAVIADWKPAASDHHWGGIEESSKITVAIGRREFQRAALVLGENLKGLLPEIQSRTLSCETAIERGEGGAIWTSCGSGAVKETPLALSTAAMGHLAQGQFFSAIKAVEALDKVTSEPGLNQLKLNLAAGRFHFFYLMPADLGDLARGGPAVVERMHAFDEAISLAESRRWGESCDSLDSAMPTLPEFRTIHLLRFIICARAGRDRSVELRSYAAIADPTTQVFATFLLVEIPATDLLMRLKNISPSADFYVERHYYAAEMAYVAGDEETYRAHLQKVTKVEKVRHFEQRLAIAESQQ